MRKLLIFFLAINLVAVSFAQKPAEIFSWHRENLPTQHIYVQFDKQAYVAGDTAWFKAYLYSNYAPSNISTNFIIDLVDEKGAVWSSKKLPVIDGTAIGNFDLPANLNQGVYLIRAYTKWVTNVDPSFVFRKPLPIFNAAVPSSNANAVAEHKFEVFPEGGKLLSGLPNNVAFRATDEQMRIIPVTAELLDSKGTKIGNLANGKEGQGIFSFTPSVKEKYFVDVTFPDRSKKKYDFPSPTDKGVVLTVADEESGKSFSALASPGFMKESETVELIAAMDNNVVLDTKVPFKNNEALGIISTKNLHPGVLQVLLFNAESKLLAERTTIIQNKKLTQTVELGINTFSTAAKAENSFTFTFPEAITGNFSVSITDAEKELANPAGDINSTLLIESGANQYIIDPKINDEQSADLITYPNSWYGSDWKKMITKNQPVVYKENWLAITGNVLDEKELAATGNLKIIVQSKNLLQKSLEVGLSPNGSFYLDSLAFEDSARIFYQMISSQKNKKPLPAKLILKESKEDYSEFLKNVDLSLSKTNRSVFEDPARLKLAADLQTKLLAARDKIPITNNSNPTIKKNSPKQYAGGLFQSSNGKTIDLVKDPPQHGGNILDYINGKIPGLQIFKGPEGYVLSSNRSPSMSTIKDGQGIVTFQAPSLAQGKMITVKSGLDMNANNGLLKAQVYLDEMETTPNTIATIPIEQIALVKYYDPGTIMVPGAGASAVLAVWKKTEMQDNNKMTDDMNYVMVAGYSLARKFFSPDYSRQPVNVEDNRTTLYWNPDIVVSGENRFTVNFYNSDVAKKFHIVLEGFTSEGRLLHFEKVIE
jgi:hypothetical protein